MITIEEILKAEGQNFNKYVQAIIKEGRGSKRHKFYKETVKHAEEMGVHIEGFLPTLLLELKRPNEPPEVREYRLQIWKAVTKSASDKIINTVSRIFNKKFFRVEFPENPSIVPAEEELGKFFTENYGIYRSIWLFIKETLLKLTFSDPNAVCLVVPQNIDADGKEFFAPLPLIYRASTVVDFVDEEYFTIYIPAINSTKQGGKRKGSLIIVDRVNLRTWSISGTTITLQINFQHNLGIVPAFRLGGQVEGATAPYWYSSFVSGIQPHWDKAITMISDLDGSIVNHLFPERYEWQDTCTTCKSTGWIEVDITASGKRRATPKRQKCNTCAGTGWVTNKSPYGVISLKRDALSPEANPPIPPAEYITKDIEPIRELKTLIAAEILAGYSAINMEILHKVGDNQSGVAKTIDRQDLDSFLMRISNHVFDYQVANIIEITARWRLSTVLVSETVLEDYINAITISKPKEFNVVGMDMLVDELKQAGTSNVSSNYYKHIEMELVNNKFSNNEEERKKNLAIIKLKPFPNKTIDQLLSANAMNAIKKKDLIRNENIDDLVDIALNEDKNFLELPFLKQLEKINAIIDKEFIDKPVETVPVEEQ